jgi:outer membrane protein OmpU
MGSITFAGEGASSAQNTIDTTAAGDIWDNTFCRLHKTWKCKCWLLKLYFGLYRLMVDGLGVVTSYNWKSAGEEATIGYALTYTGVEGLSVSYGFGEVGGTTAGTGGS